MKFSLRPFLAVLVISVAGCSAAIDSAVSSAGQGIGNAVGQRVGEAAGAAIAAQLPAVWTPALTQLYMNYLFTMAFHSGSYTFAGSDYDYDVGEWTRWQMVDSESGSQPDEMERAFLHRVDDGKEWWRVKYISAVEEEEGRDSITVEALFDPQTGEFVRMRAKMPGEEEAKELPVEEGTYGYVEPRRLTEESLEGAVVGVETVRVPAGSFRARHVRYGGMDAGTMEWWLSDDVPGGMVKYGRHYDEQDPEGPDPYNWTLELMDSGRGAQSQLGVQY